MKTFWVAIAIHLSTTSSKSSGSSRDSNIGTLPPALIIKVWNKICCCFLCSDPANLSYCSSQWSFSTLSSVTQLSAHCCGYVHTNQSVTQMHQKQLLENNIFCRWVSHPLVKKNRRVVLASFLLLVTGVGESHLFLFISLKPISMFTFVLHIGHIYLVSWIMFDHLTEQLLISVRTMSKIDPVKMLVCLRRAKSLSCIHQRTHLRRWQKLLKLDKELSNMLLKSRG